jgi:hypothetical protein
MSSGSSKKEISAQSQAVEPLKKDHVYNKAELAMVRSLPTWLDAAARSAWVPHAPLVLSWLIICQCTAEMSDGLWGCCLLQYNGTNPSRAVLVAVRGKVFDVTVLILSCRRLVPCPAMGCKSESAWIVGLTVLYGAGGQVLLWPRGPVCCFCRGERKQNASQNAG